MIAYITKYALAGGIQEVDGYITHNGYFADTYSHGAAMFAGKKEYFLNVDEAILRAEEMRNAKIKSLKKQIDKLEKMTFEVRK